MSATQHGMDIPHVVALLGAAVVGVPLFKRLGLGSVLGYLAAGLAIGPFGLGLFSASVGWVATQQTVKQPESWSRHNLRLLTNWLLWFFGAVFLLLGIIGAFLPVMPTTPFVLVTAACWGRASPRFHRWLHQHRFFGPMVQNWEQRRAVPRRAKYLAWPMMTLSCSWLFFQFPQRWYVGAGTSAVCLCVALWMARLPDA